MSHINDHACVECHRRRFRRRNQRLSIPAFTQGRQQEKRAAKMFFAESQGSSESTGGPKASHFHASQEFREEQKRAHSIMERAPNLTCDASGDCHRAERPKQPSSIEPISMPPAVQLGNSQRYRLTTPFICIHSHTWAQTHLRMVCASVSSARKGQPPPQPTAACCRCADRRPRLPGTGPPAARSRRYRGYRR